MPHMQLTFFFYLSYQHRSSYESKNYAIKQGRSKYQAYKEIIESNQFKINRQHNAQNHRQTFLLFLPTQADYHL